MLLTDSPNMTRRLGSFAGASLISLLARVHKSPLHNVVASCLSCISNNKLSTERIGAKWWVLHSINQTWRLSRHFQLEPMAQYLQWPTPKRRFGKTPRHMPDTLTRASGLNLLKTSHCISTHVQRIPKGMKSVSSVKTLTTNGWLIGILIQVGYQRLPVCGAPWAQIIKSFNKCSERNWYCARLPSI